MTKHAPCACYPQGNDGDCPAPGCAVRPQSDDKADCAIRITLDTPDVQGIEQLFEVSRETAASVMDTLNGVRPELQPLSGETPRTDAYTETSLLPDWQGLTCSPEQRQHIISALRGWYELARQLERELYVSQNDLGRFEESNRQAQEANDDLRSDLLTLCLRLCLEPADSHSPETLEVLERWRSQWEAAAGGAVSTSGLRADVRALVDAVVIAHGKHTGEMMNWPEWDAISLALHSLPESHVETVSARQERSGLPSGATFNFEPGDGSITVNPKK